MEDPYYGMIDFLRLKGFAFLNSAAHDPLSGFLGFTLPMSLRMCRPVSAEQGEQFLKSAEIRNK